MFGWEGREEGIFSIFVWGIYGSGDTQFHPVVQLLIYAKDYQHSLTIQYVLYWINEITAYGKIMMNLQMLSTQNT